MAYYNPKYSIFLEATNSFCHICKDKETLVDTHVVEKDNEVFLRKFCTKCGESFAKTSTDFEYFKKCNAYLKQPDLPEQSLTQVSRGCPFDCGVCPQHQNHPCLALFNIIDECNMKCNICYYNAGPGKGNPKSMEQIISMYQTLLKVESEPDIAQITGGEPTLHPQIIQILKFFKASKIRHLMLNTNGIRISQDKDFVKELKNIGRGFEVYLQFDSLKDETLKEIRNRSMKQVREKALKNLEEANISTTLVCVIKKGLNDKEIPEIIEYAKKWKCVRGVVFQPIQDVGRNKSEGDYRITLSEIRQNIIDDVNNEFETEDMIPLPCDPHKICVGYAMKDIYNNKVTIKPVTGQIPKNLITNTKGTIAFEQDKKFIEDVIETISLDTAMGENILKDKIKNKLFCCWPDFMTPQNITYENIFRIVIMEFSDFYNFDTTNIKRECNFMIEPGKAVPFSTFNMGLYEK